MGDWLEATLREPWRAIFLGWLVLFASTTLFVWRLWPRRQPDGSVVPATYPVGLLVGSLMLAALYAAALWIASRVIDFIGS